MSHGVDSFSGLSVNFFLKKIIKFKKIGRGCRQACAQLGRRIEGHANLSAQACAELGRKIEAQATANGQMTWFAHGNPEMR